MPSLDLDETQAALLPAGVASVSAQLAASRAAQAAIAAARSPAALKTLNATAGALPPGAITGASYVTLVNTNNNPGLQTCRSAQAMAIESHIVTPTAYMLRIVNAGTGSFTLGADDFGTVSIIGTATIATHSFRDFNVEFASPSTCTITTIGTGDWS